MSVSVLVRDGYEVEVPYRGDIRYGAIGRLLSATDTAVSVGVVTTLTGACSDAQSHYVTLLHYYGVQHGWQDEHVSPYARLTEIPVDGEDHVEERYTINAVVALESVQVVAHHLSYRLIDLEDSELSFFQRRAIRWVFSLLSVVAHDILWKYEYEYGAAPYRAIAHYMSAALSSGIVRDLASMDAWRYVDAGVPSFWKRTPWQQEVSCCNLSEEQLRDLLTR